MLDTNKRCDVQLKLRVKCSRCTLISKLRGSKIYYGPQTFRPDMGIRLTGCKKKNPFESMSVRNTFENFELLLSRVFFYRERQNA